MIAQALGAIRTTGKYFYRFGRVQVTLHGGKRERTRVSQPRNAYVKELLRDLPAVPAILLRSERYLAEHFERGGVCHSVEGTLQLPGMAL